MTDIQAQRTLRQTVAAAARCLVADFRHNTDPVYLQKKFDDHRVYTAVILVLVGILGATNWTLDQVLDPVGARQTGWERAGFLYICAAGVATLRIHSYRRVALLLMAVCLSSQVYELSILRTLEGAFAKGTGLFGFYPFVAMMGCLGLPIWLSWLAIAVVTALPPLLAGAGWLPGFQPDLYGVIVGPAAVIIALVGATLSCGYYQRHLLERQLEQMSNTDPLTGVANRRHFEVLLRRELRRATRQGTSCALMMVDIDHFKRINDTHGHPTGDRAIRLLADTCTANSRDTDLVARLGGEEFAILLPDTDLLQAGHFAERLRQAVQEASMLSEAGDVVSWTASIGVAAIRPDGSTRQSAAALGEALIGQADAALYEAKGGGRNRVVAWERASEVQRSV
ncbi:GGDEF domain-containing protein [Mitsuaria sp. GD03876]|uniref:GGDEF domain-containing protein n=1 Tax=Mitsuaria sp. GD03876 TaxID=2975399 RepID=UPI00244A5FED|nr:GGDEF domain-containing protein [Mitsuaria sp. GD03876]MDH0865109.1 GGDEF domain-containing protein [Mitsuaria sp. GD03876]